MVQVPSGEVSEVCGQLKETLVTASSSSSSQAKRGDNKTKAAFTLQQDIGTMLYDGESSYLFLQLVTIQRRVASNCDCSRYFFTFYYIIYRVSHN